MLAKWRGFPNSLLICVSATLLRAHCSCERWLCVLWMLQGSIDQVEGLISFSTDAEELLQWDAQIASVCNQLNTMLDSAAAKGITLKA